VPLQSANVRLPAGTNVRLDCTRSALDQLERPAPSANGTSRSAINFDQLSSIDRVGFGARVR